MNPESYERMPAGGLALSDFVFVKRKDEIDGTAMTIEGISQILHCHRRTLEMPPRSALAKWRLPARLVRIFRRLP